MNAPGREKNDVTILAVGFLLLLVLTPVLVLSLALPVAGILLAVALVTSLRWARDERLKPIRVLVIVAAIVAVILSGYGLLT